MMKMNKKGNFVFAIGNTDITCTKITKVLGTFILHDPHFTDEVTLEDFLNDNETFDSTDEGLLVDINNPIYKWVSMQYEDVE